MKMPENYQETAKNATNCQADIQQLQSQISDEGKICAQMSPKIPTTQFSHSLYSAMIHVSRKAEGLKINSLLG